MTGQTRPYLAGPVAFERSSTLVRWAEYLGTTFGTGGALCALRYYERLGWVDGAARSSVEDQIRGLSLEEIHSKKYDEPGHLDGPLDGLSGTPFGAHAKSLAFIAELADDDLEGAMLHADVAKHEAGVEIDDDADTPAPSAGDD